MLPKEWIDYFFYQRIRVIEKLCVNRRPPSNFLVEFTRTTPAVITDGPQGLSGSIKMVG
ncbi:hypothetical protein [Staphylothermus hellenicus]|uniref:Uncharacterized protein n=1 Tax=Staphylothermus hellenicus (strain DSM 12710 / JCM 10830 / BK20S6-10-b1 / P8) TaxID=591019 RepID=D7D831_STAHD|nr:hypothetical protein [Staphylothermus hellenicus]ADI31927.1 hypothetical protein Shell_0814 [Staphylothermus hellenicus DSM 12710]